MKLWLISQTARKGYDTYDSAVVAAETEEEACKTHPCGYITWRNGAWRYPLLEGQDDDEYLGDDWTTPNCVKAEKLAESTAVRASVASVICASFRAG